MGIYKIRAHTPKDSIGSCSFASHCFLIIHNDLNSAQHTAVLKASLVLEQGLLGTLVIAMEFCFH